MRAFDGISHIQGKKERIWKVKTLKIVSLSENFEYVLLMVFIISQGKKIENLERKNP